MWIVLAIVVLVVAGIFVFQKSEEYEEGETCGWF